VFWGVFAPPMFVLGVYQRQFSFPPPAYVRKTGSTSFSPGHLFFLRPIFFFLLLMGGVTYSVPSALYIILLPAAFEVRHYSFPFNNPQVHFLAPRSIGGNFPAGTHFLHLFLGAGAPLVRQVYSPSTANGFSSQRSRWCFSLFFFEVWNFFSPLPPTECSILHGLCPLFPGFLAFLPAIPVLEPEFCGGVSCKRRPAEARYPVLLCSFDRFPCDVRASRDFDSFFFFIALWDPPNFEQGLEQSALRPPFHFLPPPPPKVLF